MFGKKYKEQMKRISPDEKKVRQMKFDLKQMYAEKQKSGKKFAFTKASSVVCFCLAFVLVCATLVVALVDKPVNPTYAGIYEIIEKNYDNNPQYFKSYETDSNLDTTGELPVADSDQSYEYSDTNLQVAGVQEADIIKTDGKYIYALSPNYLYIIETDNGEMTLLTKFERNSETQKEEQTEYVSAQEIYVNGDRLIVLNSSYVRNKDTDYFGYCFIAGEARTFAEIYDISDKNDISLICTVGQDGSYSDSRMIDGVLYLVSDYYLYDNIDGSKPETYIPGIYCDGEDDLIDPDDVCVYDGFENASYVVVSAFDTENGDFLSNKSLLGYSGSVYMSKDNLYIVCSKYVDNLTGNNHESHVESYISKFVLNDGYIEEKGSAVVDGMILNQFSMDEYDGYFRIVTTAEYWNYIDNNDGTVMSSESERYNNLYVLNGNLDVVGKIENIAQDERVYSVRFMGDTGYFVTFKQVDPLFSVDLSDPTAPVILGELKIPGFSKYLHPYGDMLFGLGNDADEETGISEYLKLSMFDISDPANVREVDSLVLDGILYSEANYNHKAILIDYDKNIIAFPTENSYLVFSYREGEGFVKLAELSLSDDLGYSWYWGNMRGLYIGNVLYVFSDTVLISYDMNDFKAMYEIQLDETSPYYYGTCVDVEDDG